MVEGPYQSLHQLWASRQPDHIRPRKDKGAAVIDLHAIRTGAHHAGRECRRMGLVWVGVDRHEAQRGSNSPDVKYVSY